MKLMQLFYSFQQLNSQNQTKLSKIRMGFMGFLVSMIFLSAFVMLWWFWCGCLYFKGGRGSGDVVIVDGGY